MNHPARISYYTFRVPKLWIIRRLMDLHTNTFDILTLLYHTWVDVMYDLHTFPWYGAQYPINSWVESLNFVISGCAWIFSIKQINTASEKCKNHRFGCISDDFRSHTHQLCFVLWAICVQTPHVVYQFNSSVTLHRLSHIFRMSLFTMVVAILVRFQWTIIEPKFSLIKHYFGPYFTYPLALGLLSTLKNPVIHSNTGTKLWMKLVVSSDE